VFNATKRHTQARVPEISCRVSMALGRGTNVKFVLL